MSYHIEKINQIGKMVVKVVEEAVSLSEKERGRIGEIELGLCETLQAVG